MNWIEAVILGIVQGLTEFLPISSSGHLVLMQHLLAINHPGIFLEILLHMGTLLAVIIYYYGDIKVMIIDGFNNRNDSRNYIYCIVIATLPTVIVGFLINSKIESIFMTSIIKYTFFITGLIIGSTYFVNSKNKKNVVLISALFIGIAQVFAILPGISRSGITIATALIIGIKNYQAAKLSFFMSIPVLIGAMLMQLININPDSIILSIPLFIGFISSFITGYLVIHWLLSIIIKGKFYIFSIYCFFISFFSLLILD